jgi:hypothetical protein
MPSNHALLRFQTDPLPIRTIRAYNGPGATCHAMPATVGAKTLTTGMSELHTTPA